MLAGMPTTPRAAQEPRSGGERARTCKALTTGGKPCKRNAVKGLTVCLSHGGGTASSVRKSRQADVVERATLFGVSTDATGLSVEEELRKLARNKLTDILALRIKISEESVNDHIGVLTTGSTVNVYDIVGTVQSKSGTQKSRTKSAGTSVWVQELHKAENELVQILRLLHEVTGGSEEIDELRMRKQTARETARLAKAFPGLSVEDIVVEVTKKVG